MDELLQAISVVGFPIVAYGGMFWYMIKLSADHRDEINLLRSTIEENTKALLLLKEAVNENR